MEYHDLCSILKTVEKGKQRARVEAGMRRECEGHSSAGMTKDTDRRAEGWGIGRRIAWVRIVLLFQVTMRAGELGREGGQDSPSEAWGRGV